MQCAICMCVQYIYIYYAIYYYIIHIYVLTVLFYLSISIYLNSNHLSELSIIYHRYQNSKFSGFIINTNLKHQVDPVVYHQSSNQKHRHPQKPKLDSL